MSATPGMPQVGQEIDRGAEGVIYENLDDPEWVVKVFHVGRTSPMQALNEFNNLEDARAIRPDHVVRAKPPADPRQDFLVKERVFKVTTTPDAKEVRQLLIDFQNIPDAPGNVMWGFTLANATLRWILVE